MKLLERSILRRLLLLQLLALIVFLAVELGITYRSVMQFGSGEFDKEMMYSAEVLARLGEPNLGDMKKLRETARLVTELTLDYATTFDELTAYRAVFQLWSPNGELLYRTEHAPTTPLANLQPGIVAKMREGREWRIATARAPGGQLYAQVAEGRDMRDGMV